MVQFELDLVIKKGVGMPFEFHDRKIQFNGQPAVLSVARNLSVRKKMEEALIKTERLSAVGEMASGVAHNFNNLLQMIMGGAEAALAKLASGTIRESREAINNILNASRRGADVVRRIKDFTLVKTDWDTMRALRRIGKEFGEHAEIGSTVVIQTDEGPKKIPSRPVATHFFRGAQGHTNSGWTCLSIDMVNHMVGAADTWGSAMGLGGTVMNGYEATETIRARRDRLADIPILALTAEATKSDVRKCLEAGMDDYLGKPYDLEELRARVEAVAQVRVVGAIRVAPTRRRHGAQSAAQRLRRSSQEWQGGGPFNVGGRTRALGVDIRDENIMLAGGVSWA